MKLFVWTLLAVAITVALVIRLEEKPHGCEYNQCLTPIEEGLRNATTP
ncbi:MAG: hypothetical protein Q7R47_05265 [Candidatus Diapherotrites archaeon]|nr:hypothetical protein [Candidatus Diapherotrites archaeon]